MYLPDFLDGFDRLIAFDAETTGKRTPDAEFIRKQPFAWRAPGIIIEVGFVEMLREGGGWRKGERWSSRVNPDGPIDPEAIKIHRIRPADLKKALRFPTILPKLKDFVGESPIVAHAFKNERDFLDYEFARAKAIEWGGSAYPEERYKRAAGGRGVDADQIALSPTAASPAWIARPTTTTRRRRSTKSSDSTSLRSRPRIARCFCGRPFPCCPKRSK
jgi:hypothetical protein